MQKSSNNNIMDPLYLRKLLINKQLRQETVQTHKTDRAESVNVNESTEINVAKQAENLVREMREEMLHPRRDLKMNYLASMERSSYVKKVMNLPKTLPELLMQLQNEDSIADDMPQMYYQQNKQKQENLKSDIREGIIRNAKESFEETLNKGVNNNQHPEFDSESNKPTQQKPNINQEVKPDVPQTKPNVDNKPNTPQPPRHSEPTGEKSQTPIQRPNVNQEVKPDVPQTRPNVDNKPNMPENPRHSELDSESNKPTQQRPNVENKPNTPQPPRHSEANAKESQTPIQKPNINQEVKPDVPHTKPNVKQEIKPNTPQPPRHSEPTGEESHTPQTKPNVEIKPNIPQQKPNVEIKPDTPQQRPNINQEVKPNIPQTKPNMPVQPNPKPEIRPMYSPDDMVRQYENNELWQPNRNHGVNIAENRPNMPPRPPMNEGIRPEPMPQPRPPMNEGIRPEPMPQPRPPMNEGIRPEPMPQPRPPMNEGIRPEPMPQPRPPMNEGIRPEPMPRPLPPHKPIAPPHHQHPEHVDIKPDLPGFKPDVGLQEYMRYEMLRPQPLPPPTNTSISSEVHRHHHHHKHLPPPPKEEISQETQAAMNVMQNVQQPAEPTITQMRQRLSGDAAELFFTGLINLNDLSNTLKTNSKGAKAKLVLAMANASKHGIDNSQINDTLKMISASMAATETSTPSKVLKNIIELYLPWYPLQQGVGFDLSIETKAGEQDFLSVLKVWIQTRNYGNVNAILTLMTSNSVDMSIQCSEKFPKDDLLKRLNEETKNRTMQSNINVEEFEQTEGYIEPQQQAKISLSSTYEMNPYLLLMAHSFIKNTIVIDSNMSFS